MLNRGGPGRSGAIRVDTVLAPGWTGTHQGLPGSTGVYGGLPGSIVLAPGWTGMDRDGTVLAQG